MIKNKHFIVNILNTELNISKGGIYDRLPVHKYYRTAFLKTKKVSFINGIKEFDGPPEIDSEYINKVVNIFNKLALNFFYKKISLNSALKFIKNIELIQYYISICKDALDKLLEIKKNEENDKNLTKKIDINFPFKDDFYKKYTNPHYDSIAEKKNIKHITIFSNSVCKNGNLKFYTKNIKQLKNLINFLEEFEVYLSLKTN
jgi:hypothetical protein